MFKLMAQFKLKLPNDHDLEEEELMKRYEEYLKDYEYKNCQLDMVLEGVNSRSYDLVKQWLGLGINEWQVDILWLYVLKFKECR